MIVLGIESSCDETAVGIVEDGKKLLANTVYSSMDLHTAYGGVVPEVAARSHIESIVPVIKEALETAFGKRCKSEARNQKSETNSKQETPKVETVQTETCRHCGIRGCDPWNEIDAIAVTYGAGLGGSLLVGVMAARTLAIAKNKPLYAINHVEAHVYANFLIGAGNSKSEIRNPKQISKTKSETLKQEATKIDSSSILNPQSNKWQLGNQTYVLPSAQPEFPILALIVSGGHTQLVLFKNHFDYELLGQTRDDAIGEAFDKVAKIIGLPYPGGPSVSSAAMQGDPMKYKLPKAKLDQEYEFSFSGVKTAVLRLAQAEIGEDFTFSSTKVPERLSEAQRNDIAASFQRVAIETVVDKTILAFNEFSPKSVVIAGGVAASLELRKQLADGLPCPIEYTDIKLCTDNGAMIATLGCYKTMLGAETADPYRLEIEPSLSM